MNNVFEYYLNQEKTYTSIFYQNIFTDKELQKIIDLGDSLSFEEAKIGEGNTSTKLRKTSLAFIPVNNENVWLFRKFSEIIVDANTKFFHFDISKIQALQYSVYNEGDFYSTHVDTQDLYYSGERKISFTLQLTNENDYEGGNLILKDKPGSSKTIRKKGTLTLFNSMLAHEVSPVTFGTRKAVVGWVLGPAFK